jgi:hypothetical protein
MVGSRGLTGLPGHVIFDNEMAFPPRSICVLGKMLIVCILSVGFSLHFSRVGMNRSLGSICVPRSLTPISDSRFSECIVLMNIAL